MTNITDWPIEISREALAHAERHGFIFPSQLGHRVLVTDKGIATLRVDNEELAAFTVMYVLADAQDRDVARGEERAQLSDYNSANPDAELLDWVEDRLVAAKRKLS